MSMLANRLADPRERRAVSLEPRVGYPIILRTVLLVGTSATWTTI